MIQSTIFYFRWTITESSYMTTWLSMCCFLDKYCNNWNSHFPVWYKTCFPIFSKTYCSVYYETSTKEAILLVDMRVENGIFLNAIFLFFIFPFLRWLGTQIIIRSKGSKFSRNLPLHSNFHDLYIMPSRQWFPLESNQVRSYQDLTKYSL